MANPPPFVIHQILVIEADHQHATLIREALSAMSNLRVHILPDAISAIRCLAKRDGFTHAPTPDLVLVDRELPCFSVTALLEERRRRPLWDAIPVVMLSRSPDDRSACLAQGADGHALKPTDPHGWQRMVDEVLVRYLPVAIP